MDTNEPDWDRVHRVLTHCAGDQYLSRHIARWKWDSRFPNGGFWNPARQIVLHADGTPYKCRWKFGAATNSS